METDKRSEETPLIESRIFYKEDFHKSEPVIHHSDGITTYGPKEYFKKTGERLYHGI